MSKRPWYAHYEGDYALDTKHFTCAAQHGIYRGILAYLNMTGPLPDVDDEIRAIVGANEEEWEKYWPRIRDRFLFQNADGHWDQKRAEKERRVSGRVAKHLSNAGKAGAEARWKGKKSGENADKSKGENPGPEFADDVPQAIALYNEMAERAGLVKCQKLSKERAQKIAKRMKEAGGLEGWKAALERVEHSDFCRGKNDRGWKASIDFLCEPAKFTKLMEGRYDNTKPHNPNGRGPSLSDEERRAEIVRGLRSARVDAGPATPGEFDGI